MSQQKIVFAVCLIGAVVAVASAQNFDMSKCSSGIQKEMNRYRETIMQAAQKFSNSLQEAGNQATDLQPFQQDIDKLTQNMQSLTDVSQGFDVSRFMSIYLENLSTMSSLMRNSFRLSLVSGAMESYIEMGNSIYGANTQFLQRVTDTCMPNRMRRVQPSA